VTPGDLAPLEEALLEGLGELEDRGRAWPEGPLDEVTACTLFEAQVTSRLLDHTARWLRVEGHGYYTIGSAGHESNAAVALALRPTDPALLHYRSGGFYVARSGQVPGTDPVTDVLLGVLASTSEPIAGGRHKVFGHPDLSVIPQTSTIASHLPRAVGLAASIGVGPRPDAPTVWPDDAVVVCSFGDASLNHSTARGALNWAALSAFEGRDLPVLFVCEDNGLGISVPSPPGWVTDSVERLGLPARSVPGDDPVAVMEAATELTAEARGGRPALLHLRVVRYLGHAGTDVEAAYRTPSDVRADLRHDPILGTARLLVSTGSQASDDLANWYLTEREGMRARALDLIDEPVLDSAAAIMAPLVEPRPDLVAAAAQSLAGPADAEELTLAGTINRTLRDILALEPAALVFGEDVGVKGGVYGVTRGLQKQFGAGRVFDTLLDEQSIFGMALGAGLNGRIPIPEIQYLAYLHNAEDQLRGEAASLRFFSNAQYENPLVVRIAGYGYQRGFGGHFHNDNSVAVLRDIPGLVIASPAHPADAGPMLRTCVAAATVGGTVCVFLEPIARYHSTDLHPGDGAWTSTYGGAESHHIPIGRARVHGSGRDLTILTWGNGLFLSLRCRRLLAGAAVDARIVDLRWLAPLPVEDMLAEADVTGRVLVVDETRRSGGVGEGIVAALVEGGFKGSIGRVAAADSFVPLGPAANQVLVSEDDIVAAALELAR
jgi:2-oxoisovalerate dehydrogenase E1 component